MDGVLALYERHAYPPESQLYCTLDKHYYRSVKPDKKMIKVFTTLIKTDTLRSFNENMYESMSEIDKIFNEGISKIDKIRMHILSSLTNKGDVYLEQMNDKKSWCRTYIEASPTKDYNMHFAGSNKRYIGEALSDNRELSRKDILIDDYNKNLQEWENAGGTAVKYCNGINSSDTWKGFCITENMTENEIVNFLIAICTSYNITSD